MVNDFSRRCSSAKNFGFLSIRLKRGERLFFFLVTIIYVILRTTLDNGLYSITRNHDDKTIGRLYDKTIGSSIRWYIFFEFKFTYPPCTLDGLVLSRAVNDY